MGVFLKLRRIMRLGRREEGAAAVELALCLIPLVLILGIILDGGLEMFVSLTLSYGSRGGARYVTHYQSSGGAPPTLAQVQTYVLNTPGLNLNGLLGGITSPAVSFPVSSPVQVVSGGDTYTIYGVTVSANYSWIFLGRLVPGLTNPQPLSATTWMTLEK